MQYQFALPPLKIFISYSHNDEKEKAKITNALLKSGNRYEILSDDVLKAGDEWNAVLTKLREEADVFLLLVSPAYLSSKTITVIELPQIIRRGEAGTASVIPVILDRCDWHKMPFAKFQALPKFARPVSQFANEADAHQEIINALESLSDLRINPKVTDIMNEARRSQNKVLDLSGCGLRRIPRDLLDMDWLTHLYLQENAIKEIENLDKLTRLEYLNLAANNLTAIANIKHLEALTYLDLEKNAITGLKGLEGATKLKVLGLSTNKIERLTGLRHLGQLDTLYAGRNRLTDVAELEHLPQLRRIVLTDNRITSLRPLLPHLKNGLPVELKYALKADEPGIFVKGNPISDPPVEVITFGTPGVLDHFAKSEQHGEKKLEVLKLILIGNSGVGKTAFSQFLRKQKINKAHISTDTLDIQSWEAPFLKSETGKSLRVNIFDFGGQDYYHDLHRLYYSHDTAYVLLWDTATNAYSEKKEQLNDHTELIYENFPIEYWLESIQYNLHGKQAHIRQQARQPEAAATPPTQAPAAAAPAVVEADLATTAPVLVLQNKIDLGEGLLNQVALREKYTNITTFFNVSLSAKSRVKVMNEVLHDCLGKLNLAGRKLVRYQHDIIEQYLQSGAGFEVLTLSAFKDKCAALVPAHKQVLDTADARTIASILTNLGVVYFDQSPPGGADDDGIVFTRIGELNDLIKKVMNVAKLGGDKGIFTRAQVAGIPHINHILPLLLKNQSVIALSDEQFLVPQFLPVTADAHVAHFTKAFVHCHIRYVYTAYFHKSLLMCLFAKFLGRQQGPPEGGHPVKGIYYWRNGLILSQEAGSGPYMVFVNFVKEPDTCRIEIRSLYPFQRTGLEREVEKELDANNKGWSFAKEVSVNSEDFFEVAALIAQAGQNDFVFKKRDNVFTVNDFKHLVTFKRVPKKLFISYSSKNAEFVKRFWTHLNVLKTKGYIEPWYDRKIEPGAKWDDRIQKEMLSADLVIFLLSPDFLATPYIMDVEVKNAMEMEACKQCELFFIQLLHCSWGETVLDKYQMLLNPAEPDKKQYFIGTPGNDEAWKTIIDSLTEKVKG